MKQEVALVKKNQNISQENLEHQYIYFIQKNPIFQASARMQHLERTLQMPSGEEFEHMVNGGAKEEEPGMYEDAD